MKVFVVGSFPASLINFRGPLLSEMVARGHEVFAVADDSDPDAAERLEQIGVTFVPVSMRRAGMNPLTDIGTLREFVQVFRTHRPDVILTYTIKPVIYGSWAARLSGVPASHAMVTGLGHAFVGEGRKGRLLRLLVKVMYRSALDRNRTVFFQNPDDERLFRHEGLLRSDQESVVLNGSGVDLERFDRRETRAGRVEFLWMGRLIQEKGVREFVEASGIVRRAHPRVRCRIVGALDANPSSVTQDEVDSWVREGLVEYEPWTDDVRSALARCSVFVLPSYREGTPRSVLEAMATGRPIVTTDVPGCRETVVEGDNGFLVPPRDPASLARAMSRFVVEPELLRQMGDRSLHYARTRYDVRAVNRVILENLGL